MTVAIVPAYFRWEMLREQAVKRAKERFMKDAKAAVYLIANSRESFSTDDVWGVLEMFKVHTRENRALGPVMQALQADGVIVPSKYYENSKRRVCHGRPVKIWHSKIRAR